jgi:putative pyruvate formate lyase activating enzyme
MGNKVGQEEFAQMCLVLQERGAENINLVTGSHAVPALVMGIKAAQSQGLTIPILWNSSAYECLEALSLLEDMVDVYLPDLKTLDPQIGRVFFHAPDYPEQAQRSIIRMMESRSLKFKAVQGLKQAQIMISGVIIRHLVLPGYIDATRTVLKWFAEHCQDRALLSVMMQYTPLGQGKAEAEHDAVLKTPDRYVSEGEYEKVLRWLEEFEIEEGFYQELVPDMDWLPDFTRQNPFASDLSIPIWHWKDGFAVRN